MSEMFTEISEDDLAALLAGSRRKGLYTDVLDSLDGQKAVMVNLNDGELKGKDAQTVYQGLNSAIAKNTDKYGHLKAATRTINDVKHVYIVNSAAK